MLLFVVILLAVLAALLILYRPSYVLAVGSAFIVLVLLAALIASDPRGVLISVLFSMLVIIPLMFIVRGNTKRRLQRQFDEDTEYLRKLREERARAAQVSANSQETLTNKS